MFEALDAMWDTLVQGWWVQVCWVMLVAFWVLHTALRAIHAYVAWPSDRAWKFVWVVVSVICSVYFFGQMHFADHPYVVPFGLLARNIVSLLLIVTLMVDAARGIRGTAARRVRRATEHPEEQRPPRCTKQSNPPA